MEQQTEQKYRMFHADGKVFHVEKHTSKSNYSTNECLVIDTLSNLHIVADALRLDKTALVSYEEMLKRSQTTP